MNETKRGMERIIIYEQKGENKQEKILDMEERKKEKNENCFSVLLSPLTHGSSWWQVYITCTIEPVLCCTLDSYSLI